MIQPGEVVNFALLRIVSKQPRSVNLRLVVKGEPSFYGRKFLIAGFPVVDGYNNTGEYEMSRGAWNSAGA